MSGGTTATAASQISEEYKSFTKAAFKNTDADLKTKLDGVFEAFRAGRMPDNSQIDNILFYLSHSPIDMAKLSPEGQSFATHFRDIIHTTRLMVKEKNAGELLQNLFWHTFGTDFSNAYGNAPTDRKHATTVGQKTASNQSHAKNGQEINQILRNFALFFFTNPDIGKLLAEASSVNKYLSARSLIKAAEDGATYEPGASTATGRISEEQGDRVQLHFHTTKELLDEEFPKEWRDKYVYRVQKLYLSCQVREEYIAIMAWFKNIGWSWLLYFAATDANARNHGPQVTADSAVRRSTAELRVLVERFTQRRSIIDIENASRALYEVAHDDEDFCRWYHEADALVNKALFEPGYVLSDACYSQWEQLTDSRRPPFKQKYKLYKDNLVDSISTGFSTIAEDPLIIRISSDWKRLAEDLLFDADGHLIFKPQLLDDIYRVILPALVGDLDYIPIPRIEYSNSVLDLAIENLAFQGRSVFPSVNFLRAPDVVEAPRADAVPNSGHKHYQFTFFHEQTHMPDVAFYFKKKTGFPKFTDSGFADVYLGGEGLTIIVQLETVENNIARVLNITDVKVILDSLKFSIRDSKHDFLYNILRPLIIGLLKSQIKKAAIEGITNGFEAINEMLVQAKEKEQDRMVGAQRAGELSRRDILKRISERNQVSSKKAETADSHLKIVFKTDSESLPKAGPRHQAEKEIPLQVGRTWRSAAFSIVNTLPDAPTTAHTNTTLV